MESITNARKLANYIKKLNFHEHSYSYPNQQAYNHIGALYTNIVLQAGLNYKSVVEPRVARVLIKYPEAETVTGFLQLIDQVGLKKIIRWSHPEKLSRLHNLLTFSKENNIETCAQLADFLRQQINKDRFLQTKGVGFKTLDYTLKLLNFDTVAVDRHIYSFLELAGLEVSDYHSTKKMVEFAADLLRVSRASIDYSIWKYMSNKTDQKKINQLAIEF